MSILFLFVTQLFAQQRNGMVNDNYAGRVASMHNPANIADSRFKFNMHIVGFNAHLQQNYLQLEPPHSMYKFLNWKWDSTFGTENRDYPFEETYVKERLNGRDKFIFSNGSVDAFSMQFSLKDRSALSFGLSSRAYANVSNLPESAIKTFLQDLDKQGYIKENQQRLLGENISIKNASAAVLAYQQYSLKYAFIALDKRSDFFKVGVGLDYNVGLYGGYARIKDANYTVTGIDTLLVDNAELEVAYISPDYLSDPSRRLNDFFGSSRLGRGIGVNLGVVYEHRPNSKAHKYKMDRKRWVDNSTNKYDWKVGASIVNLGFVNFNNGEASRYMSLDLNSPTPWNNYDSADLWDGVDDVDSFTNSFFPTVEQDSGFMMYTPATCNLTADYKVRDNWYISANYTQSLIRNNSKGVRMPNVLSVAPRYERRWFTASIPVAVSRYYNIVNVGAYVRAGVFYMGSDNLGGFFTGRKTNGANIYAGFNWPIHYKKLKDADSDGVSDDLDECPATAGSVYTDGCPDRDGDKVADDEDLCPEIAGSKRTNGCPDKDEDGTADNLDECPEVYGSKKTSGCPDSDGDGVHDGADRCPDVAGEERYDGCAEAQKVEKQKGDPIENRDSVIVVQDSIVAESSKFDNWDFTAYEYWPVLGAYNDPRWAEELQSRLNTKLGITATIKSIPGVSKYYVTLGKATTLEEAKQIQVVLDKPSVNTELNGSLWWKKVVK